MTIRCAAIGQSDNKQNSADINTVKNTGQKNPGLRPGQCAWLNHRAKLGRDIACAQPGFVYLILVVLQDILQLDAL